jgi:hypothetical protein
MRLVLRGLRVFGVAGLVGVMAGGIGGCRREAPAVQAMPVAAVKPEVKAAPATPIAEKKDELGLDSWDPAWDAYVEKALPKELLSNRVAGDVRRFCPRFGRMSELDRKAYWAYFFQALSGTEAGLKPTTNVRHTQPEVAVKDDVTKRMVRSEGLLQLTYMDAKRYGCDFDWEKDKALPEHDAAKTILQPKNNLECGVKILTNQLIDQGEPLLTAKSYWGPLHPGWATYRTFAREMANVPGVCRVDPNAKKGRGARPGVGRAAAKADGVAR